MTFERSLAARLAAVVTSCRVPIDPRCRLLLAQFIDGGIARFDAESGDDGDRRIDEAVDNLRRVVDDMVQQMRILRFDALHEPNLSSAIDRLRPLWPFS